GDHNVAAVAGFNYETRHTKGLRAVGENLVVPDINDLNLVGTDENGAVITSVGGGQSEYALMGISVAPITTAKGVTSLRSAVATTAPRVLHRRAVGGSSHRHPRAGGYQKSRSSKTAVQAA